MLKTNFKNTNKRNRLRKESPLRGLIFPSGHWLIVEGAVERLKDWGRALGGLMKIDGRWMMSRIDHVRDLGESTLMHLTGTVAQLWILSIIEIVLSGLRANGSTTQNGRSPGRNERKFSQKEDDITLSIELFLYTILQT